MALKEPQPLWFRDDDWDRLLLPDDLGVPLSTRGFFADEDDHPSFEEVFNHVIDERSAYLPGIIAHNENKIDRRCNPPAEAQEPALLLQSARHFLVDQERTTLHLADRPGKLANGTNFARTTHGENSTIYTAWNATTALLIEVAHDDAINGDPHPKVSRKAYLVTRGESDFIETVLLVTGQHVPNTKSEYHLPWAKPTASLYSIQEGAIVTLKELDIQLTDLLGHYGGGQDLDMIPA